MNWYKYIFAANDKQISYLRNLGVTDDIISFVNSIPPQNQQFYINELRKNPRLTIVDLQSIQLPQKVDPYLEQEKKIVSRYPEWFQKWALTLFRKIRMSSPKEGIKDLRYTTLKGELNDFWDWANRSVRENIASYTDFDSAYSAKTNWEADRAFQGEGKIYGETDKNLIVYGPRWKNKSANGWTVQEVRSKNDLETEGNLMNHCVGDYCENVEAGESKIYSLRDPQNNPHVTIETDASGIYVRQIKGNSNKGPKPEYKILVVEWIKSGKGPKYWEEEESIHDQIYSNMVSRNNLSEVLDDFNAEDEYGLGKSDTNNIQFDYLISDVFTTLNHRRRGDYEMDGNDFAVAEGLVNLVARICPDRICEFEDALWKSHNENESDIENTFEGSGESFPDRYDYETDEEFDEAVARFEKMEDEARNDLERNTFPCGFYIECYNEIEKLRKIKKLPLRQNCLNLQNTVKA